ncbi:hypothetical protein LTR08_008651 [Meristemomyces frigidus]|nr:hypothetical protein LTR08_008651 [Meristemomyces frigidus]
MADGRRSKRLKVLHQLEDAPAIRKSKPHVRGKAASKRLFRLMDLPTELRLIIYEIAFEPAKPKGRRVFIQLFDQVYNYYNSNGIPDPDAKRTTMPPHALLLVSKLVYNEGIQVYFENTKFEVRCYAEAIPSPPSPLGPIANCHFFGHIRYLQLNIYIDTPKGLRDFINRLLPLLEALDYGRKLVSLDLAFMHNCRDEEDPSMYLKVAPTFDKLKSINSVFQRLGCNGRVHVRWHDAAFMVVGELCEESRRATKLVAKLRDEILDNGKAFPQRGKEVKQKEEESSGSHDYPDFDFLGSEDALGDEEPVEYDDDLGDAEWVSEDDEWFSEDEDRFDYI